MVKQVIVTMFILLSLASIALLSGCTFIVKGDHTTRYYGIDQQRGSEFLNQILDKQQQVYQSERASAEAKKP